jgi:hypothetical protein
MGFCYGVGDTGGKRFWTDGRVEMSVEFGMQDAIEAGELCSHGEVGGQAGGDA